MDMATAMATMATMERGRLRPTLLLSLAMATTVMAMATDTTATMARGRLSLLLLLRLLLSPDTATAMVTAMGMATVMDMATATTARGRLMPSPDMATTAAMDTAMDTATTVRERTDYLQS